MIDNHSENLKLLKEDFGPDFQWGVSVAAYQIEGAHESDGKGASIWDIFTNTKGKIKDNHHGNIACDFYNRFRDDIDLIKELNIPNFRFSISWSRILPNGIGEINQQGLDYYNQIIDYCLQQNIEPWITLYHWDLPHALELKGGWTNREVVKWFQEFVKICADNFGDRVKNWMVMNEPIVFTGAGYFLGIHAPGRRGMKNFLPAIHHTTLAIAAGGRMLKNNLPHANIGTTFSCSYIQPHRDLKRDQKAAKRVDALLNRLFIEPLLGLGYPEKELPVLKGIKKIMQPSDNEDMLFDFDFIGIQNYTREIVKNSWLMPYVKASLVKAEDRKVPITEMKWEIYPEAIYHMIKQFNKYPQIKKLLITENGAAFKDELENGSIRDERRKQYIQQNLQQILKAKQEGLNIKGYFVWTLTDNFEWAEGYHPRFGLIHVDFETQKRTIKESGLWFKSFLRTKKSVKLNENEI
ncbi:MAG: beta-glucosidase [Bacteroidetes bacterium]|nr:beta-glucosidase [Bacteroidota bacterium]MBU1371154.1 beta-glucosidase [Bacteroidota bacterium]MBU1484707.1 beta-glucosidase [Bacteroidota bacterium]MBU1760883.1 beta-glucosidase [Bacteroidota bacterium]MBU2267547.1 beta-glucosidase [Bacteroidota bacterium]